MLLVPRESSKRKKGCKKNGEDGRNSIHSDLELVEWECCVGGNSRGDVVRFSLFGTFGAILPVDHVSSSKQVCGSFVHYCQLTNISLSSLLYGMSEGQL